VLAPHGTERPSSLEQLRLEKLVENFGGILRLTYWKTKDKSVVAACTFQPHLATFSPAEWRMTNEAELVT